MKNRFLTFLAIGAFAIASLFGIGRSAWALSKGAEAAQEAQINVPAWRFDRDADAARIEKVGNCSYLEASRETTIVSPLDGSVEGVRLTNTAGKQAKSHSVELSFDTAYTLGDIRFQKVEFDYYHVQKREQVGKGFPKVQLLDGNVVRGTAQGGGDTVNAKSPFISTNINGDWWHLEYFITAMAPTITDHGDAPMKLTTRITSIRITDEYVFDYGSTTAFVVVDNVRISSEPCSRLGLFNRTSSFASGGYFWVKVAWAGVYQSVNMTISDDTVAEYAPSSNSPFYIRGLKPGRITVTTTMVIGEDNQTLSITTNTLTVT